MVAVEVLHTKLDWNIWKYFLASSAKSQVPIDNYSFCRI